MKSCPWLRSAGNWWLLGGGVSVFKECDFWYAAHAPVDSLAPMHILVALSFSGGFKKRMHTVGEKCWGGAGWEQSEGRECGFDQNTLYIYMKLSIHF